MRTPGAAELAAVVTAFGVTLGATGIVLLLTRKRLVDVPNERSSHVVPTPRSGGLGIVAGILASAFVGGEFVRDIPLVAVIAPFLLAATLTGLADDAAAMRPRKKMLFLVGAAVMAAFVCRVDAARDVPFAGDVRLGVLAWPLTVLWLACYPNAFNFMDGLNGIAALTAAVSGGVFFVAGLRDGDHALTVLGGATCCASLGFLPWNFPGARIFMGDAGSLPLGMMLAFCAVLANRSGALAFPACMLLLGPFMFDVTFTLVRRAIERKVIGEAHREHLYQRLSRVWNSHAKVTLLYGAFAVVTGCLALIYRDLSDAGRFVSLAAPGVAMLGFAALVLRAEREKGA